jgi:hypothetical protein
MTATTPDTTRLYEILVRLHDDVRQIQYPYSAKALKWGIISHAEIERALEEDPNASEKATWTGQKPTDVAARLAGGLTRFIDVEGYREKWGEAGLAEGSWKTFLEMYCMLKADPTPFNSTEYYREAELTNLLSLVKILDDEIFSSPAMKGPTNLDASLKSKWWKECHRVFNDALVEEVYRTLSLDDRPKNGACHTPEWTPELHAAVRKVAKRWVACPLWDRPATSNPAEYGVDFTSNNEATVKSFLRDNQFTSHYLEGRS